MKKGDTFAAEVTVEKVKKGKVTVIQIDGEHYVLRHKDQYRGGKEK